MRVGRRDLAHLDSRATGAPSSNTETLNIGVPSSGFDAEDLEGKLCPEEPLHAWRSPLTCDTESVTQDGCVMAEGATPNQMFVGRGSMKCAQGV
jgi:hypothetical protein